jgi:coatomer subunit beta'
MSMDGSGKVLLARHNEVQQAIVGRPDENAKDGEALSLPLKELGSCEIYPQAISHSPNGR